MFELLEKTVLTALGAAALTQKKGEDLVEELKTRYKVTEEEGRALLDRIQEIARSGREQAFELAKDEVARAFERLGAVPREEFDRLERRVAALEALAASGQKPGSGC